MIAYFDMFSGVSGDMILGALVDAGLDARSLRESLRGLPLPAFELETTRVRRGGLAATLARWTFADATHHRHLPEIEEIVRNGRLPSPVEARSLAVFRRLAEAEGRVHGIPASEVHFHEVGAMDAILDVCGAASALHLLGVERVEASPFRTGGGYVEAAHGRLPVPAPAVALLLEGWRIEPLDVDGELTTPTGAAIVTTLAPPPGGAPGLLVRRVGHGAGSRDRSSPPNCLRVLLGDAAPATLPDAAGAAGPDVGIEEEELAALETTIDDMNPQLYGWLEERLLEAGAREVFFAPVTLKRGRPGTLVRCLAGPDALATLSGTLFRETTTLGVRSWVVRRWALARSEETVATSLGPVRIKRVRGADGREELRPEYEECRRLALALELPLRVIAARLAEELSTSGSAGPA